jgi:hypothetical protein
MITPADWLGIGYLAVSAMSVFFLRTARSNRDTPGSDGFALLVLGIIVMTGGTGLQFIADGARGSAAG